MNLYFVMCLEITNNVWVNDFCVNGRIFILEFFFIFILITVTLEKNKVIHQKAQNIY